MSYYNAWQGFDDEKKPLQPNFNVETNGCVLRFKVNNRENYVNYIAAWIANIIQYPAFHSQLCVILYSSIEGVGKTKLIELIEKIIGEHFHLLLQIF
jgi:hypothetical protein